MAEGGDDFGYKDPYLDHGIDDDDDDDEQAANRTQPFQPGAASTPYQPGAPYHGGEEIQMQTTMHEQSGLPSYAETPLLGDHDPIGELQQESFLRQKMKKAVDFIRGKYPNADFEKLKIRRGKGKGLGQIVAIGPKGGQYQILKQDESGFTKPFLKNFGSILGPQAEEILNKDNNTIQEQRQRLADAEKQEQEAQNIAAEKEKQLREIEDLKQKTEMTQARIDALQEEQGSNLESEVELKRLKQLNKNHKTELDNKEKELAALEKQAKKAKGSKEKVATERAKLEKIEKKRNQVEERLNSTKP